MQRLQLLEYNFNFANYNDILELLQEDILAKGLFSQIISINPENYLTMVHSPLFAKIVLSSRMQIADGIGIVWAARFLGRGPLVRLTGVELMDKLIRHAYRYRLRCLLIGGESKIADTLAKCYREQFPGLKIGGISAFTNVTFPKKNEMMQLKEIVLSVKPQIVFVAFGTPAQELWINANRNLLNGCLVVGVGGAFSMLSGAVPRAPKWLQQVGLEWWYRLVRQPWRWRRQLALLKFTGLVIKEKLKSR